MASNTDRRKFTVIHPYNSTAETSERLILSTGELESWVGQWLAGQHPSDSFYVEEHSNIDSARVELAARALWEQDDTCTSLMTWDEIRQSDITSHKRMVREKMHAARAVVGVLDR